MNPHKSWGARLGTTLIWALFALIFGLTGWTFGLKPVATTLGNGWLARDYQAVDATIVERSGRDADGEFKWLAARYEVAGKRHETSRMTLLDDDAIDEPANDVMQKSLRQNLASEKPVTVWVSPRDADVAVVSRDLPWRALLPRLPMAIGFTLFALAGVSGVLGALFSLPYYTNQFNAIGLWIFAAIWCAISFAFLRLVTSGGDAEWFVVAIIGFFVMVGIIMLYGAIAATITGKGGGIDVSTNQPSKLPASALATSYGKRGKRGSEAALKGDVKRGGMGGRGDNYDKD